MNDNILKGIPLSPEYITLEEFKVIDQYYKMHNFKPPAIVVNSDEPQRVFSVEDFDIIMKFNPFDGKQLVKLIQTSIYLGT